jgi:lipopolysaccharide export LptBFGC system permease protein LptF
VASRTAAHCTFGVPSCGASAARPRATATSPAFRLGRRDSANAFERASTRRRVFSASFPTLLDDYVLRDFFVYLGMILSTFLVLLLVFTLFELLGDILRNQTPFLVVAEYLLNVAPYLLYSVAPLIMLLAVLITFGLMNRSNEITAIKATGTSIYRIVTPVMVAAQCWRRDYSLPTSSTCLTPTSARKRCTTRSRASRRRLICVPTASGFSASTTTFTTTSSSIPTAISSRTSRSFKSIPPASPSRSASTPIRAHWADNLNRWIFEQGWERSLNGPAIAGFRTFDVSTFPELSEAPSYFKKEVKQYSEMNYEELRRYIRDLQQSGFDVVRLRVQLYKKLSFPLITLIMAVLAVPFSLSASKKGAITGVAVAVGIAVVYTVVSRLFEAMGDLSQLAASAGGMVAGPDFRAGGRLHDSERFLPDRPPCPGPKLLHRYSPRKVIGLDRRLRRISAPVAA